MKFGRPPNEEKAKRPPVRLGGQKTSPARAIVDTGETRGAPGMLGRAGRPLGSTGKGPPPKNRPPARAKVPKGPGAGMLPGITGPGLPPVVARPRMATPILAIGERATLGPRTKAAMAKRGRK
jgi:hypothetical protein